MKRGSTKKLRTLNARIAQVRSWIRGKQEEAARQVIAKNTIPSHGPQNPTAVDQHYNVLRTEMNGLFRELGLAA